MAKPAKSILSAALLTAAASLIAIIALAYAVS